MSQDPIGGVTTSVSNTLDGLFGSDALLSTVLDALRALGFDNVDMRTLGEDFERLPPPLQERLLTQNLGDIPPGQLRQLDQVFGWQGGNGNGVANDHDVAAGEARTALSSDVGNSPNAGAFAANADARSAAGVPGGVQRDAGASEFSPGIARTDVNPSFSPSPQLGAATQANANVAQQAGVAQSGIATEPGAAVLPASSSAIGPTGVQATNVALHPQQLATTPLPQAVSAQAALLPHGADVLPPALAAQVGGFTQSINPMAQLQQAPITAPANPGALQPGHLPDNPILPAGHTGEGQLRRDLRDGRGGATNRGLPPPAQALDPWRKRIRPETAVRARTRSGTQWLYWLLIVVAYGGLMLAIIALATGGREGMVDRFGHLGIGSYALMASVVAAAACWWVGRRLANAKRPAPR